jgi:dGTPase
VREGLIKHSRDYCAKQYPELKDYLLDLRPPLEAQLIDVADEIAYNTADLDDGLEAEILTIQQMRKGIECFDRAYKDVEKSYPKAKTKSKFYEALKRVVDRFAGDLIDTTRKRLRSVEVHNSWAVREYPQRLVGFSESVQAESKLIKQFLHKSLYDSAELREHKERLKSVIADLFNFWMEKPDQLPANYREQIGTDSQARVICDYIAGMTDNFILEQHRQLFRS